MICTRANLEAMGMQLLADLLGEHHLRAASNQAYDGSDLAKRTAAALDEWINYRLRGCGYCHTCWNKLSSTLWCSNCGRHRRYVCHGYIGKDADETPHLEKDQRNTRKGSLTRRMKEVYLAAVNNDEEANAILRDLIRRRQKGLRSRHGEADRPAATLLLGRNRAGWKFTSIYETANRSILRQLDNSGMSCKRQRPELITDH